MAGTANSIITPQTPKSAVVNTAAAQATFPPTTTPTNTVALLTAGANGARLVRLQACPQETTTANNCQLYRSANGGTNKLYANGVTLTATVGATAAGALADFGYSDDNPLFLAANEQLFVAVGVAKSVNFVAEWADY
jgi:hypothetical protein